MQFPHGTTIAVTDGQKLRLFRNAGDEGHLRLTESEAPTVTGRTDTAARQHHGGSTHPEERRMQEDSYTAAVADWLNRQCIDGRITHLFVVAPPRTLGELRKLYHTTLQQRLLGELGKEYVNDPVDRVHDALANL